jgi:hypothetical protein
MFIYNNNIFNLKIISNSYDKKKINYYILNYQYIIFININNVYNLKNILLSYNITSFFLKETYIKSLFFLPIFSFLRNGKFLCIFIKEESSFINIIKIFENKEIFYSYKKSFSNLILNTTILKEYNNYKMNYTFIHFILKKLKIKIILLFLFFLISLIKIIK